MKGRSKKIYDHSVNKVIPLLQKSEKSSVESLVMPQGKYLFRDFMADRLYASPNGYFMKQDHQVGKLKEPIEFSSLFGQAALIKKKNELYPSNQWLTPSELFRPYYGYAVANFMLNQLVSQKVKHLNILEIGPGRAALADSILEYLKYTDLRYYRNVQYNLVEISPVLAQQANEYMWERHPELMSKGQIKVFQGSIYDFKVKQKQKCFVLMTEILDNLVHDRCFRGEGDKFTHQLSIQVDHDEQGKEVLSEVKEPIKDELIKYWLKLYESCPQLDHIDIKRKMYQDGVIIRMYNFFRRMRHGNSLNDNIFIPTGALSLLMHLKIILPNHNIIAADFDDFIMPDQNVKGINAPIISRTLEDPSKWATYDSLLVERGAADICFPTNFHFLQHAYYQINDKHAAVYKNKDFMDIYADKKWTETICGYDPLREMANNTSFMVSEFNDQEETFINRLQ